MTSAGEKQPKNPPEEKGFSRGETPEILHYAASEQQRLTPAVLAKSQSYLIGYVFGIIPSDFGSGTRVNLILHELLPVGHVLSHS